MQLHRGEYPNLPKKASDEFLLEFIKVNTKSPSPQKFGVNLILVNSFFVRIFGERGASGSSNVVCS